VIVIDGNLVSAKHPEATDRFMQVFLEQIEQVEPAEAAL
jgi:hypothetical protein